MITIEKGNESHIDELEKLYDDLNDYFSSRTNYPGWIKHVYPIRETAIQAIENETLFVALSGERIAGSVILNHLPEDAYGEVKWLVDADYRDILVVHTLVVHPSFFGKKVGTFQLNFAKEYAVEQSCKSIRLDVSENNIPAIALYEKMGYKYVGTVDLKLPYEHLKWFRLYELAL